MRNQFLTVPDLRYDDRYDNEVHHIGRGESYRPGGSRPQTDTWGSRNEVDTYVPGGRSSDRRRSRTPDRFRRRSRSPPGRGRDETYSARARSPPPRRYSPRRDERPRSPVRRRSRSPHAGYRSPPPMKRPRDPSPYRRSPPPAKRERLTSPPRRYERSPPRRQYSPRRDDSRAFRARSRSPPPRRDPYNDDNWRRRSPSPRPLPSGPASAATSRRSSPPVHPDRMSLAGSAARSPAPRPYKKYDIDSRPPPRSPYRPRSPRRERSPPPPREDYDEPPRAYVHRTRELSPARGGFRQSGDPTPPTGPAQRNGFASRPPPSGPSRGVEPSYASPPSGPSSSIPMSAHTRSSNPPTGPAPVAPRGPPGSFRDGPRRDYGGPPPRRGPPPHGPPPRSASYDSRDGPPGAPRGNYSRDSQESHRPSFTRDPSGPPPFLRHNNSTSTTYPRTQRFNNTPNYLANTEKIVSGGKALPPINPEHDKRVRQLESEAEKMREIIAEKQKLKRAAVREWEDRERDSESAALKSDLAERHLEKLTGGEEGMSGAAF
ncbi:MAG: hypothetical protein Q9227_004119 [Pyrenula ochraceoflavens]